MRLPLTVATAALAAVALAASLAPGEGLEFVRERVGAGQSWRLLTCQLVHYTPRMAAWDLGTVVALVAWLEHRRDRRVAATSVAMGAVFTALAVHALSPDLVRYRGSSGIASALFVAVAVRSARGDGPLLSRVLAAIALTAFLAKVGIEAATGQACFAGTLPPGVAVVPLVHLLGGLAGLAAVFELPRATSRRYQNACSSSARMRPSGRDTLAACDPSGAPHWRQRS